MGELADKLKTLVAEVEEVEDQVDEEDEDCDDTTISSEDYKLPFKVGKAYFIRTVTYHLTGKVKAIKGGFLVLKDAAWIADSGRFMDAINKGELSEVEPVKTEVFVNTQSITDAFPWNHKLPREQS